MQIKTCKKKKELIVTRQRSRMKSIIRRRTISGEKLTSDSILNAMREINHRKKRYVQIRKRNRNQELSMIQTGSATIYRPL